MRKIIYLSLSILLLASLITLQILGAKERVGYLSDFKIIEKSKIYDIIISGGHLKFLEIAIFTEFI